MATLGREVVNALLLGASADGRLVHDSPVRGDVWAGYAAAPGDRLDLLIQAYRDVPTGQVAAHLAERLYGQRLEGAFDRQGYGISFLEGFVAARIDLNGLIRAVLPFTSWIRELRIEQGDEVREPLARYIAETLDAMRTHRPVTIDIKPRIARLAVTFRVLAAIDWAAGQGDEAYDRIDGLLTAVSPAELGDRAAALAADVLGVARGDAAKPEPVEIFSVSRNRPVELAIERSVPAVKADAARALFSVTCEKIGWAVLDSGIDGSHPAFKDLRRAGESRIAATYDFTRLREVVLVDHLYNPALLKRHAQSLAHERGLPVRTVAIDLCTLATDARARRPINWSIAERYVVVDAPLPPSNPHGTHVAGILGGCWDAADYIEPPTARQGICPDIRLFDFRVVSGSEDDSEFALIAALQFIRYLNSRNNYPTIHGANISLSIRHDVRNYACGRTPVCEEAERAVASGVVVVAAAGNRGYQSYHLSDGGAFETYAPSSITDPGNAESVITVGATHRSAPHNYGVSFFSSRGPTGDGRSKPDLVAPGEKIWSVVPGETEDALSGTSMAAPHVSGAAAMLMARNAEFIGQSTRIKRILCGACTDLGRERFFQGAGMLDILRAMQSV